MIVACDGLKGLPEAIGPGLSRPLHPVRLMMRASATVSQPFSSAMVSVSASAATVPTANSAAPASAPAGPCGPGGASGAGGA